MKALKNICAISLLLGATGIVQRPGYHHLQKGNGVIGNGVFGGVGIQLHDIGHLGKRIIVNPLGQHADGAIRQTAQGVLHPRGAFRQGAILTVVVVGRQLAPHSLQADTGQAKGF